VHALAVSLAPAEGGASCQRRRGASCQHPVDRAV